MTCVMTEGSDRLQPLLPSTRALTTIYYAIAYTVQAYAQLYISKLNLIVAVAGEW